MNLPYFVKVFVRFIQQSDSKKYTIYTLRSAAGRRDVHDGTRREALPLWPLLLRAACSQSCYFFADRSEQASITSRNDHSLWTGLAASFDGCKLTRHFFVQEKLSLFSKYKVFISPKFKNITGNAGRQLLDFIADGLFALSKPNVTVFAQWMNFWKNERINKFEAANGKETEAQRNHFIQQLIR